MRSTAVASVLAVLVGWNFGACAQPASAAQPASPTQASAPETPAPEAPAAVPAVPKPAPPKASKPYFIEFRARNALSYGHTFAVFGRAGQKLTKANVVGLHPATESSVPWVIGHFVLVPSETGWSDGDIEDQYIIAKYRVPLSEAEYKSLSVYLEKLKAKSPVWHAVLYNCNAFVGDIATHMGMQIPSSSLLMPKEYITELRNLNSTKRTATPAASARVN